MDSWGLYFKIFIFENRVENPGQGGLKLIAIFVKKVRSDGMKVDGLDPNTFGSAQRPSTSVIFIDKSPL